MALQDAAPKPTNQIIHDPMAQAIGNIGQTVMNNALQQARDEAQHNRSMAVKKEEWNRQDARQAIEDTQWQKNYDRAVAQDEATETYRKKQQAYQNEQALANSAHHSKVQEHNARMEGIAEQKRQDEMKSVKERFMNEKGQVFNLQENGEVVPVMEKQGRKQLSNKETFYAPFGDEGMPEESVQMKGMPTKTTGKPDRWSAEQNIKLINERITELKAIEQGDIMNGREPRALTNDEKAELNTLNNNRLALINGGSIETSQASTTTSQNNHSGMRKVSPEKAIANMKAAGIDEAKIQEIIKKEYSDYKPESSNYLPKAAKDNSQQTSKSNEKSGSGLLDMLLDPRKIVGVEKDYPQEIADKIRSLLGWQRTLGQAPTEFNENDIAFAKEVISNPEKYEKVIIDAAKKALKNVK